MGCKSSSEAQKENKTENPIYIQDSADRRKPRLKTAKDLANYYGTFSIAKPGDTESFIRTNLNKPLPPKVNSFVADSRPKDQSPQKNPNHRNSNITSVPFLNINSGTTPQINANIITPSYENVKIETLAPTSLADSKSKLTSPEPEQDPEPELTNRAGIPNGNDDQISRLDTERLETNRSNDMNEVYGQYGAEKNVFGVDPHNLGVGIGLE